MKSIFEATRGLIAANRKDIDHNVHSLKAQMEQGNTLLPANLNATVQRAVAVYGKIKPLLTLLSMLPILPPVWREGIKYLKQVLGALSVAAEKSAGPEVDADAESVPDTDATANFKAGKDIAPAA